MALLKPGDRLTGRGHEVITIGPDRCPNGHELRPPNLLKTSNVEFISYGCGTCRQWINRRHDGSAEWVTQDRPGRFDARPIAG